MIFYRYDIAYNLQNGVELVLYKYDLLKETPQGYWIVPDLRWHSLADKSKHKRWVHKVSRKRFAYPTKKEALNSFIIRKKKQIIYCKRDMRNAERALAIAEKINLES